MDARSARSVALRALLRIDDGAYANLALPALLDRARLDERDRAFATELTYGTTRMRRACDWLVDRFLYRDVEPEVRAVLRLGAYQLVHLQTPPHAAVGETVGLAPGRARGLVNAVLRRVADAGPPAASDWPDEATELSYPDWIVERLALDLGHDRAVAALRQMNEAAQVTERDDGYIQDEASQQVAEIVGAQPGDRIADVCAAPGGKAAQLAQAGARVTAVDRSGVRLARLRQNLTRLKLDAEIVEADATLWQGGPFDAVLVDAPCSSTGTVRRHPDIPWLKSETDLAKLAVLQSRLLDHAMTLVKPGGTLVYCTCSLEREEGEDRIAALLAQNPTLRRSPIRAEEVGGQAEFLTADGAVRTLPCHWPDAEPRMAGLDGFYAARITRPEGT
jgi:16S rRNA (cytosine967-C5)-methyltransferase